MIFIYTTCGTENEAKKIGRLIVKKRLAGCINTWPIDSIYWWKEKAEKKQKITQDKEWALLIKTLRQNFLKIEKIIMKNHSYSVPCIARIDVAQINSEYKEWLGKCVEL